MLFAMPISPFIENLDDFLAKFSHNGCCKYIPFSLDKPSNSNCYHFQQMTSPTTCQRNKTTCNKPFHFYAFLVSNTHSLLLQHFQFLSSYWLFLLVLQRHTSFLYVGGEKITFSSYYPSISLPVLLFEGYFAH